MITDVILLLFLFALLFGLLKLVSLVSPASSPTTTSKPGAASGASFDWNANQLNLKTNLRPVTQQDLLDSAEQKGIEGGRFVASHAESFSFGKKQA